MKGLSYRSIATIQLEQAIAVHLEQRDYVSAITLAGAADEILGKKAIDAGKSTALGERVNLTLDLAKIFERNDIDDKEAIKHWNNARNSVKHLDVPIIVGLIMDYKDEAEDMITRAIDNYVAVYSDATPSMKRFQSVIKNAL